MADSGIEVTGLAERIKQLGEASTKNPEMRKRINEVIRKVLARVRTELQNTAREGLDMKNDPRNAYKAVRMAVYKRLFGGQVNILNSRKAKGGHLYEPPRKGTSDPKGRGGNRVKRTDRTTQMMSYSGADRGFVLRFLNQGAGDRVIHSMGGSNLRNGSTSVIKTKSMAANRGTITARNWFGNASQKQLEQEAQNMGAMLDEIIKSILP